MPPAISIKRAGLLFADFFLIILAYYQIKPASRSLFIEFLGADQLPYVWIATALVLVGLIGWYHRMVAKYSRLRVILVSCLVFIACLVVFRLWLLVSPGPVVAAAFYIYVDIFSVVLVEQFWSLANTTYSMQDGKRWYGFIGTGGLLGGFSGGLLANQLLNTTPLQTGDLLLVAAAIICLVLLINLWMARSGGLRERIPLVEVQSPSGWRALLSNRYLLLIGLILLLAQMAQPLVEYKFMQMVADDFTQLERRTAFISLFFSIMGAVSICINLLITPVIHRLYGVITGLVIQPVLLSICTAGFMFLPGLWSASLMKISDRGLSYSINRASKELLYIPIDPVVTYQAKAWIDMFGYRLFKVIASVLILLLTQWIAEPLSITQLGWVTLGVCLTWLMLIRKLAVEHRLLAGKQV